ncbi:MAG: hypothetical protein HN416_14085 [Nitrospina sp.]|jgi:hypothetical protein|nr:hypothetical protein [Nitrospina sp.]
MSEEKVFYANESSQYGEGVMLDEYNGSISLVSARKKEDQVYMEWCYPQAKDGSRKPIEKSLPWKITLGDREGAIKALRFFLRELGASEPGDPAPDGSDENTPF